MRIVARRETGCDVVERRGEAAEVRLLRQIAHGRPGLQKARAGIGIEQPGCDLQHCQRDSVRAVVIAGVYRALCRAHAALRP